ncbi:MAG: PQQ-binding-like beta-propeller repeat protein [Patescibacteria group bacterium]|nr:PQQ-binding-like beta-propeller repeat protein [Patescibacteria group bacterium]
MVWGSTPFIFILDKTAKFVILVNSYLKNSPAPPAGGYGVTNPPKLKKLRRNKGGRMLNTVKSAFGGKNKFFGLVLVAWSSLIYATNWPMFQGDAKHTGRSDVIAAQTNNLLWKINLGVECSPLSSPIIGSLSGQERILLGTESGIYIVDLKGNLVGLIDSGYSIKTTIAALNDFIYFGAKDSFIVWNADSTKCRSYYLGNGSNISHPTLFNGKIYVHATNKLWCFNDSALEWTSNDLDNGNSPSSAIAVDDSGNIYAATLSNTLAWYDFRLYAFNPNGTQKWVYEGFSFEPGGICMTPTVGPSNEIFVATLCDAGWPSSLYSIKNGSKRWQQGANIYYLSPAIFQDKIVYGSKEGLNARLISNGNSLWQYPTASPITISSPAIGADGTIYIGTDGGIVLAVSKDGTLKWQNDTQEGQLCSPAIGDDSTVYINSSTGKLFAYRQPFGIEEKNETEKEIFKAIPNPLNLETEIRTSDNTILLIYGLNGQLIRTLSDFQFCQTYYKTSWNGRDNQGKLVASGIYFCQQNGRLKLTVIR